jgi:hypothetical protein
VVFLKFIFKISSSQPVYSSFFQGKSVYFKSISASEVD